MVPSLAPAVAVMAVTGERLVKTPLRNVVFTKSARQGGTDTTAKLVRAGAKWLFPGLEILVLVWLCGALGTADWTGRVGSGKFERLPQEKDWKVWKWCASAP